MKLEIKKRGDKIVNYFLIAYFLGGLAFAFCYDTWYIAFGVGSLSLLAYYFSKTALPKSHLYQYVLSAVLGVFMAQFIYQMHGLFEMHFFAFIGSAILITYQNWKLQIPLVLVVLVHHALFGYLQNQGLGKVYFTQLDSFSLQTYIIHIVLAAIIFFICGLWAYQLKKSSDTQILQAEAMERLQYETLMAVSAQKEQLERHVAVLDKAVAQGKFEVASDVMHDIGNAVVGFGSYLTRMSRLQDQDSPGKLKNLAGFFRQEQTAMTTAIGENKARAVIDLLDAIAETQLNDQEEIRRSVSQQTSIVANIQEILHIQRQHITGHDIRERPTVNLRNIVSDALAMLYASVDKMAIAVNLDIADDLPPIKGDRTRLIQVMLNLLKNSIEAIGIEGQEKAISLRTQLQPGVLTLEIRDSGNGFDSVTASRLFERGFTTKPNGKGLALYNSREIIESHSGSMTIASPGVGKGTSVRIAFKL